MEQNYLESFKIWFWRRMVKIKWSEKTTNEEVLQRTGEEFLNYILHARVNWIGHIL